MKNICVLLLLSFLTSACHDEKNSAGSFFNDFETMGYWSDSAHLKKGIAKSGLFCTYTDSIVPFSEAFKIPLEDIKSFHPHTVTASAWVMANDINAKSTFVLTLDSAGKSVAWNGTQTTNIIQSSGKWVQINCTLTIPEKTSDNEKIYMYGWYGGKGTVYYDDFLLQLK